jgi:hypothetical protein
VFGRICAANLTGPLPLATGEWIELRLRFAAVIVGLYSNLRLD